MHKSKNRYLIFSYRRNITRQQGGGGANQASLFLFISESKGLAAKVRDRAPVISTLH